MGKHETKQLATELSTVVTRLIKKLRKKSVAAAKLSLTARSVIAQLDYNKQMLPSELAAAEKITTQSMSQILNQLLEMGLITRTVSDTDKRKVNISLTPDGSALLNRVRSEKQEWLANVIEQTCSVQEQQLLKDVIGPLSRIVDFE